MVHRRDAWGLPELLVVPYEDPDGSVVVRSDELHLGHAQQPGSGGGSGGGGGGGRQSNPDNSPDAFSLHPHPNSDFEANFFSFSTTTPLAPFTDWCFDLETAKLTVTAQQDAVGAPHFAAQHYRAYRRLVPPPDDDDMQQQHPPQPQQQHPPQPPAVPVTLVHREGIPLDGTAPLLMLAYGAYGTVLEPDFKAEHLALLRRGWVIAYCHARGGGELGPRWHQAGARLEKPNTMADLERCILNLGLDFDRFPWRFSPALTRPCAPRQCVFLLFFFVAVLVLSFGESSANVPDFRLRLAGGRGIHPAGPDRRQGRERGCCTLRVALQPPTRVVWWASAQSPVPRGARGDARSGAAADVFLPWA